MDEFIIELIKQILMFLCRCWIIPLIVILIAYNIIKNWLIYIF